MSANTPPPALEESRPHVPWYRSFRFWVSAVTAGAVIVIVIAAWPTMVQAFQSLADVNLWILALLVPVQLASFAVTGEVLFSYLRGRGELHGMHPFAAMRMSLEFNFANHMLPSGGAAGITYTSWKLSTLGVAPSKGTLAQLVRFAVTFVSFCLAIAAAATWLIVSGQGEPILLWTAAGVGALALGVTVGGAFLLRRRRMLHRFAGFLTGVANRVGRLFGKPRLVEPATIVRFFDGLYQEVRSVSEQPKALVQPFLWSFLVHVFDSGLYWVALLSFGVVADPALVFVAYGMATLTSMIIVTPNGVGGYEVVLIGLLVAGGLAQHTVIAAIVLARAILLIGTIVFGWAFYQHSIAKASKVSLN